MENFIVSARKYRPATFQSVVGQQHITSTLKNAIERGQLAHAYLFCGPRGVGKTTCARIFAKAINCEHPEGGVEACNHCESCRSFNENRSLNIHELDAASNNSVDDIRNLIDQVRILPQGGRYSVFIIDEVHMLSTAAFNAFLKTLEEPPAHAIFILATTEKHKILPTILSRCQIYDFNRIKVDDAVGYLKYIATQEGVTFDEESLNLIAQKADGGMRDALSMFDKAVSFCGQTLDYRSVAQTLNVLDYDTYFSVTEMLLGGDYLAALRLFDEVLSKGFSGQTFMSGLSQHMRDLLVARDTASLSLVELTGVLLERYQQQAKRCPVPFLFGAISLLSEADSRIRQSSNQRLLVELGLMKIAGLGQKKNNDIVAPATPQYSLPTLGVASTKSVSQSVEVTGATSQPQGAMSTNDTTASATPLQVTKSVAEESLKVSATTPISTVNPTTVPKTTKSHSSRATLIGGQSINDLMTQSRSSEVDVAASESTPTNESIDAQCEQKLQAHRSEILDYIERERPRLYAFFEQMTLANHTLTVLVPSESLKEEILRNKLDILPQVAQIAGVACTLELEVKVVETMKASKPIKLEDRIQYMSEQNPLFVEMRRVLDLEVEN